MGAVLGFTAAYLVVMWAYGIAVGSPLISFYGPITVVLVGVMALIHRSVRFSRPTLWALSAVGLGNMAGGVLLVDGQPLYLAALVGALRYDKVFHAVATGVAAWASWEALRRWAVAQPLGGGVVFATVLMAAGAGSLVEIIEFTGTQVFPTTNVGDYANNMLDLVANLTGAVVGAEVAWRYWTPPTVAAA